MNKILSPKRLSIICIVIIFFCMALSIIWCNSRKKTPSYSNPLVVNTNEIVSVSLYWHDIFSGIKRSAELSGSGLNDFCALWNENWVCHLEPYDTMEDVNLSEGMGEIWSQVTFNYKDSHSITYHVTERYIVNRAAYKYYFHTSLLLINEITLHLNPDAGEGDLW